MQLVNWSDAGSRNWWETKTRRSQIQCLRMQMNIVGTLPATLEAAGMLIVDVVCSAESTDLTAKKAKDGTSGTLVWCDGLPNIIGRRRRNFWDGTHCQSAQSWIQRQKPAARLLFVLRRDMLRVKTVCNGEDGKNPQWFARRQTLIRYNQQESAMIRKKAKNDPLRSASKATMQGNTSKRAHKEPCNSPRAAP